MPGHPGGLPAAVAPPRAKEQDLAISGTLEEPRSTAALRATSDYRRLRRARRRPGWRFRSPARPVHRTFGEIHASGILVQAAVQGPVRAGGSRARDLVRGGRREYLSMVCATPARGLFPIRQAVRRDGRGGGRAPVGADRAASPPLRGGDSADPPGARGRLLPPKARLADREPGDRADPRRGGTHGGRSAGLLSARGPAHERRRDAPCSVVWRPRNRAT